MLPSNETMNPSIQIIKDNAELEGTAYVEILLDMREKKRQVSTDGLPRGLLS